MVSRFDQTRDATPEAKAQACALLTAEINAAVDGILDARPDADVVVLDGHGNGGIVEAAIHPRARLIMRSPTPLPRVLDGSFDALFFVGQHAMAGTPNAPLCHTYSSKTIEYYKLNGQPIGEIGMTVLEAGCFGVPVAFLSGDDKAVAEAKAMIPGIHGAVVKWGLGIETALHLSPEAARGVIRTAAAAAIADLGNIPPVVWKPPYELEIRVYEGKSIEWYLKSGAEKLDERTVRFVSDDFLALAV